MSVNVEVKLSRSDRVYHAGDDLLGEVVVTCGPGGVQHSGIRVWATGSVSMRVSERAVGVFEAFFLNVRPIALLNETIEARETAASAAPCSAPRLLCFGVRAGDAADAPRRRDTAAVHTGCAGGDAAGRHFAAAVRDSAASAG